MTDDYHVLSDEDVATYMDIGITAEEVVRLAVPNATQKQCAWILWELTNFPISSGLHDIADQLADLKLSNLKLDVVEGFTDPAD